VATSFYRIYVMHWNTLHWNTLVCDTDCKSVTLSKVSPAISHYLKCPLAKCLVWLCKEGHNIFRLWMVNTCMYRVCIVGIVYRYIPATRTRIGITQNCYVLGSNTYVHKFLTRFSFFIKTMYSICGGLVQWSLEHKAKGSTPRRLL
jgi:hypothetical protein